MFGVEISKSAATMRIENYRTASGIARYALYIRAVENDFINDLRDTAPLEYCSLICGDIRNSD
jgi:hypothetical protein